MKTKVFIFILVPSFLTFTGVFSAIDEICIAYDDQVLLRGETHQPANRCELLECTERGMAKKSCPIPFGHNSCVFMRADFTKPFPDCCLRIECPKDKPPRFISRNKLYDLLKIS
uniref:Single domain-containing protein n=1 Tax=Musca domestica TaxID=7370 RepID=A0A1I8NJZ0_MUSDO